MVHARIFSLVTRMFPFSHYFCVGFDKSVGGRFHLIIDPFLFEEIVKFAPTMWIALLHFVPFVISEDFSLSDSGVIAHSAMAKLASLAATDTPYRMFQAVIIGHYLD